MMKMTLLKTMLGALAAITISASAASGLALDTGFYGFWDLNIAKSEFGPGPSPKAGLVTWNKNGFTFSILTANGQLYADGVTTRGGCGTIGLPDDWSCEVSLVSSKHLHLIMKQGGKTRRIGDIELLPDGTTRTVHQVFPAHNASYVETTFWDREKN